MVGIKRKSKLVLTNGDGLFVPNRDEVLHIGDGNQDIKFIEEANIKGLLLTKWSSEKELLLKYKESNNIFVYDSIFDFMEELYY